MRDVSGDDPTGIPHLNQTNGMSLYQNTDNPGDGNTVINYVLNTEKQIKLSIFDMIGNEVKVLFNGKQSNGSHTILFDRSQLAAGVYTYKLTAGNQSISRKMVVVKK